MEVGYWKISEQSAKIANNLHKSKQGIAQKCSPHISAVWCFSYLRKSRGETCLVLYCLDFPYFSPLLFVFNVDLRVLVVFLQYHHCIKQRLPERFISSLFPCFLAYSIEESFCYAPRSFCIPASASSYFSFQVARLTNTYSRAIFALSSLCQYKGFWANFSSLDFLGLFLVLLPSAVAGLPERMKAIWAVSFKQPRHVYHNYSPFTATMCACAQFTVVVFLRGLWCGFIGCSRCPFGCKCIYLSRSVYTRILENVCLGWSFFNFLLWHPGIKLPLKIKANPTAHQFAAQAIFTPFLFFPLKLFFYFAVSFAPPSFEPLVFCLVFLPLFTHSFLTLHSLFFLFQKISSSPFSFAILPFHFGLFPHPVIFPLLF